ncbi:zinc ribbon domain-containing protein [Desulfovibrio sp.]|uniref:FmdB family zinc ribbon protein n=1 Tax=Desulfovibrio sp. TaxID=885 RepID=UPI0023CDCC3C|nr:zinc ribbon domain-containing protein [Desulfovibrio sp.]MDE7241946.1 zinc ribbon domain-containing protein [Desulfovibrio sp.]
MPMFEFCCRACGEVFEELLRAGDTAAPACPKCGAAETERRLSVPAPLKTGAFPFKPGPVRPLGTGGPSCGTCGMGGGMGGNGCGA